MNVIADNSDYSVLSGGDSNSINSKGDVIGGGLRNQINTSSDYSFIGGGDTNLINSKLSIIGGGYNNKIAASSNLSFVGGGDSNNISSINGTIGGGLLNQINTSSDYSFIGGGDTNLINSKFGAIGGGYKNKIATSSNFSFVGGGDSNTVSANKGVIGGGLFNQIDGSSDYSTIGGGQSNLIFNNGVWDFIGGGYKNFIGDKIQSTIMQYSTIGGGDSNSINAHSSWATLGGGQWNTIDSSSPNSFLGGGLSNIIQSPFGTIDGGNNNKIFPSSNLSVIGGGRNNLTKNNMICTIPGGDSLIAQSYAQTVLGFFNRAQGTTGQIINGKDRLLILGNGAPAARTNSFEVSNNGHSIVYHTNGSGGADATTNGGVSSNGGPPAAGTRNKPIAGTTYRDNIIYAWGDVEPNMGFYDIHGTFHDDPFDNTHVIVHGDFGVKSIARTGAGEYTITLSLEDPIPDVSTDLAFNNNITIFSPAFKLNPTPQAAQQLSVQVTIIDDEWKNFNGVTCTSTGACVCAIPQVTRVVNNVFKVHLNCAGTCDPIDRSFNFVVTGRPHP